MGIGGALLLKVVGTRVLAAPLLVIPGSIARPAAGTGKVLQGGAGD